MRGTLQPQMVPSLLNPPATRLKPWHQSQLGSAAMPSSSPAIKPKITIIKMRCCRRRISQAGVNIMRQDGFHRKQMWLKVATRLHLTSDVKARTVCREEHREGPVDHPCRRTFNQRVSSSGDSLMKGINRYSTTSWVSENPPQALSQSSLDTRLTALVTSHKMPSRLSSSSSSSTSNSLHPHCDSPRRIS